jgi:MerR family mercuric resistance operon transcriptional regulator
LEAEQFSRGALARKSGVKAETIRYYEKVGLVPDPPRSAGGHRVYGPLHVQRLSFIRRCRELGFNLDTIRDLLALVDGGTYTCAEVLEIARTRIADVRSKIRDLKRIEKALVQMTDQCSGKQAPECAIVDILWKA